MAMTSEREKEIRKIAGRDGQNGGRRLCRWSRSTTSSTNSTSFGEGGRVQGED